jgi:dipeptidyl aminopeptidase/acylaminoacyl peptidase
MKASWKLCLAALCALLIAGCSSQTDGPATTATPTAGPVEVPLLPRTVLFDNPERAAGSVSPDGRWLGYLAPVDGVLNVWVAPAADPQSARAITRDSGRGILNYQFARDGKHLLYLQDSGGDENFHVFAVDLDSGESRDLTPFPGARAELQQFSPDFPGEVIVAANDRDPRFFDLHRIDIASGVGKRIQENNGFAQFVTDHTFSVRLAIRPRADGGNDVLRADGKGGFEDFLSIPADDALTTQPLGFGRDGTLYMLDSRGRDTGALVSVNLESGTTAVLYQDARADVSGAVTHPITGSPQAVAVNYLRNEWTVLDPALADDFAYLATLGDGEITIAARSDDDALWSVMFSRADTPSRYFLYDRPAREAHPWFTTRPALADAPLAPMHPVEIKSRDGLTLVSYLTLPRAADPAGRGRPAAPQSMVLLVHGGPWARDGYGYNSLHQWLANRGYAVLSVNFRGSTGFGKNFVNAGNLQWAAKMHDDLLDALEWAVAEGVADPEKVAIMGGSYGGYATLVGLTFTPETFACGVDIVGPSNINTLLNSIPPYWESFRRVFATRVGDPETEEGRALLDARSPLNHVERIVRPLLIGQGANDPRVKQAESDQIVEAMRSRGIPVTYVLFPDEGHGFARPPNRLSFFAVAEGFLGTCLGGRAEPIGNAFDGSSVQVPEGAAGVPGLAEALQGFTPSVRM